VTRLLKKRKFELKYADGDYVDQVPEELFDTPPNDAEVTIPLK